MNREELKSIIAFAVENEEEAYEFYKEAMKKVEDKFLKDTFKDLANEELKHKEFLNDFLLSDVDDIRIDETVDYKISQTIDMPKLSVDMKFSDAIGLAIKKEEEAMNMYKNLSDISKNEDQKMVFDGLEKMERMHKTRLEEIYINVAYNEIW